MKTLAGILAGMSTAGLLTGCAIRAALPPAEKPVRWVLVEKRLADVIPEGRVGDGRADPEAFLLTLVPLARDDVRWEIEVDPHDYYVEVLEITPSGEAAPGESVTATVRVARARKGDVYRLRARASRPDVEILGPRERVVREDAPALFRFTSRSSGRGGIAVEAERVEDPGR
ncbi:MAG TPA: hypothetical protein VG457_01205 [Planctomycetota bacterium]|nr:hypothetical protein [Planctomycetota bacterium]